MKDGWRSIDEDEEEDDEEDDDEEKEEEEEKAFGRAVLGGVDVGLGEDEIDCSVGVEDDDDDEEDSSATSVDFAF